jgi:hypothetical protein
VTRSAFLVLNIASKNPAGADQQGTVSYHRVRSRRISKTHRMFRSVMNAFRCSGEPTGKSGRALVIRTSRLVSSLRVSCISSKIDNARMISSVVFDRAIRGLLAEALSAGRRRAASRATATKRRSASALATISRRMARNGRKQGQDWRGRMEDCGADGCVGRCAPQSNCRAQQPAMPVCRLRTRRQSCNIRRME